MLIKYEYIFFKTLQKQFVDENIAEFDGKNKFFMHTFYCTFKMHQNDTTKQMHLFKRYGYLNRNLNLNKYK